MQRLVVKRLFVSPDSFVGRCGEESANDLATTTLEGDERGAAGDEAQADEEERGH
jgi:hypothetical protein